MQEDQKQSRTKWAKEFGYIILGDTKEADKKVGLPILSEQTKSALPEIVSKSSRFLTTPVSTKETKETTPGSENVEGSKIEIKVEENKKVAMSERVEAPATKEETPKVETSEPIAKTEESQASESHKSEITGISEAQTERSPRYISKEQAAISHGYAAITHFAKNNLEMLIIANLDDTEIEKALKDSPELLAKYKARKAEINAQKEAEIKQAKESNYIAKRNNEVEALKKQDKVNGIESSKEQLKARALNNHALAEKVITINEASENIVNTSLKETPKAAASGDDNIVKHNLTNASKMRTADFKNAKEVADNNQEEELFIAQANSVNKAQEKTHKILNKYYPNYNEEAKNKHIEITKNIANKEIEDLKKDTLNSNLSKEEVNKRLEFLESKKEEVRITAIKIHNEFVCNVQTKSNKKIKNITKQENKKQEDIKENKENSYTEKEKLEKKNKKLSYILNMILATIKNLKNKPHKDVVNNKAQLDTAQNLKNHLEQKLADNDAQIRLYDLSISNDNLNRDLSLIKISNNIAVETAITNSVIFS